MAKAEILLASFNGEQYVRAQIDSILAQRDEDWHLTLSDDGSSDGTTAILDEYEARFPQKITRHRAGKRFGNARDHFFHLMAQCEAPYMLFCDQDDVWYPDKVGKTLAALCQAEAGDEGKPVLAFCDQRPTDASLQPLAQSLTRYQQHYTQRFDYRALLLQNVVTGGAMGINRAAARLAERCIDPSRVIMHDWWLAVVTARFGEIVYLNEVLADYRQHGHNEVGAKDVRSVRHVLGRFAKLGEVRELLEAKKKQARIFDETYAGALDSADRAFLDGFEKDHSGAMFYWRYRHQIHGFWRLTGMMALG